jgi:ribonuclease VapC
VEATNKKIYVLDSWPVLEWIQEKEPAASLFGNLLESSLGAGTELFMGRINYGEILYNCRKYFPGTYDAVLADIQALPIDVLAVDDALVNEAAALKAVYPIAYADCFAAALALRMRVPLVTGDKDFRLIPLLNLIWIGE